MLSVYENDPLFRAVDSAFTPTIRDCMSDIGGFSLELFAATATEKSLPLWESAYGLHPGSDDDADTRRAALLARLRSDGLFTRAAVERIVGSIADEYTITEEPGKVIITCKILIDDPSGPSEGGDGTVGSIVPLLNKYRALHRALESVRPAHITLEIKNKA